MRIARAVGFQSELSEGGRSKPLLIEVQCGSTSIDVVVKIASAKATLDGRQLVREAVATALAARLGLPVPDAYVVEFADSFIEAVEAGDRAIGLRLREHVRLAGKSAFATQYLRGFGVIGPGWPIPDNLTPLIAEVFTFDALTLNRDRCIPSVGNPNCLTDGHRIVLIDHEQALDAEILSAGAEAPWHSGALNAMCGLLEHIFARQLKGSTIDLSRLEMAWAAINSDERANLFTDVPVDWDRNQDERRRVLRYMSELEANLPRALLEVQKVLS